MAIQKNFVIKNGLQVNQNLIFADNDSGKVGINTTQAEHVFDVRGGIGVSDIFTSGITTGLGDLLIGAAGTAFAVMVSAGNSVGIGTSLPQYPLQVFGPVSTGQTALDVRGDARFTGKVNVGGALSLTDSLYLSGNSDIFGNIDLTGDIDLTGSLTVDTNATITGNMSVAGNTGFTGDVTIGGKTNINNQLRVSGVSTFVGISTFEDYVVFDSTGAIRVPKGDTSLRPVSPDTGQIRYNTQTSTFEGFGAGNTWGSLGGVKDVDQDTYITPEVAAGTDEDRLDFYTAGQNVVAVSTDRSHFVNSVGIGTTNPDANADPNNTRVLNVGIVTANDLYGDGTYIGLDSLTSSTTTTAIPFTTSATITEGIDRLNQLAYNIIADTAVSDVTFTSSSTQGGDPFSIVINVAHNGNANRYDVDWGDGTTTLDYSSSSIPHTYTTSGAGGVFTIQVTAKNNTGVGAGSSSTFVKTDFITVYTPDPGMDFELFRTFSTGSPLSGNDLYVVEGQPLFLDNNTTNTGGAAVSYTVDWGDGTTPESSISNNAPGGVQGPRLQHTWVDGKTTGTGRDTVTLTLDSHTTANPNVIPRSVTKLLKVYENPATIAAPDGLSTKTIGITNGTGSSPLLAYGFTDNINGGGSSTAGDSVTRYIPSSGTITAGPIPTFAYNADTGILSALVSNAVDGSKLLTSGGDAGTYGSLVIDSEADYNLYNAAGAFVGFNLSIYAPGNFNGFKARIRKPIGSMPTGLNSMQLSHSITGNTNIREFVKDTLTAPPTVHTGSATLTENVAGTYRYISGVPYYNSGSPSLTISGVAISNLVGQTYTNQSNIVEVDDGTNSENTTSNTINNTDYSYVDINNTGNPMLTGAHPNANTGTVSPYQIADLTVPINTSNVIAVGRIKLRAKNVNGTSSYTSDLSPLIQVYKQSQTGISEIAIDVSSSLGSTYTDDGVRIFNFSTETTDNPLYNNLTNFYTSSPYTEVSDPGVSGTKEATVRIGRIQHDVTNYSVGHLPAGPNRSGDGGTQYFTFAFRREAVSGFNINIQTSGIAGLWIAAPGTQIDNTSTINGWLRADQVYNGSGIPGANVPAGGNGSNGCAANSGAVMAPNTTLNGNYAMTLGTESMSNATGNVVIVRIALTSNQTVHSLSIN